MERGEHFAKMDVLIAGVVHDVSRVVSHHQPHESAILVEDFPVKTGLEHP